MLNFFRKNDPYKIIPIFLILILIRSIWVIFGLPQSTTELKWLLLGERLGNGFVMYSETYDYTGPLAALIYKWLDIPFGPSRWIHLVFSSILVIVQASLLNTILLKNKAFDQNNYLPAFLYVILTSATMDFFSLSPQLMSLTFIILSLNQIFRRIDNVVKDDLFLYAGIFNALAFFIYLPSIVYFFAFLLSFIIFSTAVFRRLLLYIYGFSMVLIIIICYFYWFGAVENFWQSFFIGGFTKPKIFFIDYSQFFQISYVLLGTLILSMSVFFTARFTNFQQNMMWVMVFFIAAAIVSILISPELSPSDLLYFIPPSAFFLTHYLLNLQRRIVRFILPITMVAALVIYPWVMKTAISGLLVEKEVPQSSGKLMVIGDDLSQYIGYEMASPFIDPYLGKKSLEGLDYYGGAAQIHNNIITSDPDIILDQWGVVPQLFERFPVIEKRYEKLHAGEYRKISN